MTTSNEFRLSLTTFRGRLVVALNHDGNRIGHFHADGSYLCADEIVSDFDDLTETADEADALRDELRERAMTMLAEAA